MDQNFFFKWVWRFNGLALALVLIAATIGVAAPFLVMEFGPVVTKAVESTAPEPTVKPSKYRWRLEFPHEGREHAVLSLVIAPEDMDLFDSNTKDGRASKTVNYLFVDAQTGTTRWLFPTHDQLITTTDYMWAKGEASEFPRQSTTPPVAVVYNIIAGDPNLPRTGRRVQVYISKLDGASLTKILDALDEVPLYAAVGGDKIVFTGKSNGKPFAASFSLTDFKPLAHTDLSALTPK